MPYEFLFSPDIWAALVTLTILEIVLGIDNLIIISILTDKLPVAQQPLARKIGLGAALATRIMLLSLAFWIVHLNQPLFTVFDQVISWRDILLVFGGLFLIAKGTIEIHNKIEGAAESDVKVKVQSAFAVVIVQIAILDIVFSFDSVMTAIGVADHLAIMVIAIVISMIVMVLTVEHINGFISRNPTVKILALSYLILIGLALIGDGFDMHIPKGYLYFAMAFSLFIEVINMAVRRRNRKAPQSA